MKCAVPALWMVSVCLAPAPTNAQTVQLRLRDDSTGSPVGGAIVRLLDQRGVVAQALSTEAGQVTFRVPSPGVYRLRIDRIGYTTVVVDSFDVTSSVASRRELRISSAPAALPAITVHGETRCDHRGPQGGAAVALWDEIRKALTATLLSEEQWETPLHLRMFEREVGLDGGILRQWTDSSTLARGPAFTSLDAAEVATHGFVRQEHGVVRYAGPDALLLLTDAFVATHCFRATPGQGTLGHLVFEPEPDRRLPDIRGTLAVDRATSELRSLEFAFTGLEPELAEADLGGRVEFTRLRSGAWIVSWWHIRMPRVEVQTTPRGDVVRLTGYRDRGGRTEVAAMPWAQDSSTILGRVYDSTTGRGLSGAIIRVAGREDSTVSGEDGDFTLRTAAAGDQTVEARHRRLGLAPDASARSALLSLGDTTRVDLAVPRVETIVEAHCGRRGNRAGVIGLVTGPPGTPVESLTVQATWRTSDNRPRSVLVRPRSGGAIFLCSLPAETAVTIAVHDGERVLAEETLVLNPREYWWMELGPP